MVYIKEVSYVLDNWFWRFWPFWRFLTIFTCLRRQIDIEWPFLNRFLSLRAHSNRLEKTLEEVPKKIENFEKMTFLWRHMRSHMFWIFVFDDFYVFETTNRHSSAISEPILIIEGSFEPSWETLEEVKKNWKFRKNDVFMTSYVPKLTFWLTNDVIMTSFFEIFNCFWYLF